jgi:hypothetical protein
LDGDGDPLTDSNQTILVHAESYGSSASRRAIEAVIVRKASGVRVATWREWH